MSAQQIELDHGYKGVFVLVLIFAGSISYYLGYGFIATILVAICWLNVAIVWMGNLACWSNTSRLFGKIEISDCFQMLRIADIARFGPKRLHFFSFPGLKTVFGLIWAGAIVWGFRIIETNCLLAITVLAFSLKVADYSHRLRPPVVFVLGKSDREVVSFQARLFYETRLIRIVSLLDIGRDSNDSLFQAITPRDCLRTTDETKWQEVVRELMRIAPIIVIDARFSTEAVVHEILQVHSPDMWFKVILLVGNGGEKPALADAVNQQGRLEPVVYEAQVETAIRLIQRMTGHQAIMPSRVFPVALIAEGQDFDDSQ